jgi:hypothetical protein
MLLVLGGIHATAACGGTTVVDGGSGGAGSTTSSHTSSMSSSTTSTSTSQTGTTTGGGQSACAALEQEMVAAFEEAVRCNPAISSIQCSGDNVAKSYCDCAAVANDKDPDAAARSLALGNEWRDLGCEYMFCEGGCYPTDAPWFCDPATERCQPAYD